MTQNIVSFCLNFSCISKSTVLIQLQNKHSMASPGDCDRVGETWGTSTENNYIDLAEESHSSPEDTGETPKKLSFLGSRWGKVFLSKTIPKTLTVLELWDCTRRKWLLKRQILSRSLDLKCSRGRRCVEDMNGWRGPDEVLGFYLKLSKDTAASKWSPAPAVPANLHAEDLSPHAKDSVSPRRKQQHAETLCSLFNTVQYECNN